MLPASTQFAPILEWSPAYAGRLSFSRLLLDSTKKKKREPVAAHSTHVSYSHKLSDCLHTPLQIGPAPNKAR